MTPPSSGVTMDSQLEKHDCQIKLASEQVFIPEVSTRPPLQNKEILSSWLPTILLFSTFIWMSCAYPSQDNYLPWLWSLWNDPVFTCWTFWLFWPVYAFFASWFIIPFRSETKGAIIEDLKSGLSQSEEIENIIHSLSTYFEAKYPKNREFYNWHMKYTKIAFAAYLANPERGDTGIYFQKRSVYKRATFCLLFIFYLVRALFETFPYSFEHDFDEIKNPFFMLTLITIILVYAATIYELLPGDYAWRLEINKIADQIRTHHSDLEKAEKSKTAEDLTSWIQEFLACETNTNSQDVTSSSEKGDTSISSTKAVETQDENNHIAEPKNATKPEYWGRDLKWVYALWFFNLLLFLDFLYLFLKTLLPRLGDQPKLRHQIITFFGVLIPYSIFSFFYGFTFKITTPNPFDSRQQRLQAIKSNFSNASQLQSVGLFIGFPSRIRISFVEYMVNPTCALSLFGRRYSISIISCLCVMLITFITMGCSPIDDEEAGANLFLVKVAFCMVTFCVIHSIFVLLPQIGWCWRMNSMARRIRKECLEGSLEDGNGTKESRFKWWIDAILEENQGEEDIEFKLREERPGSKPVDIQRYKERLIR